MAEKKETHEEKGEREQDQRQQRDREARERTQKENREKLGLDPETGNAPKPAYPEGPEPPK